MLGQKYSKNLKFEYYLRQCEKCGKIYKASPNRIGKRPKGRVCDECKEQVYSQRLKKIMETKTKNLLKEVENEFISLDCESETFI